jgi:hypothetical protein
MRRRIAKLTGAALVTALTAALAVMGLAAVQTGSAHPVEGTYDTTATGNEIGTVKFIMKLKRNGDKWVGEVTDSPVPLTINTVTVEANNKVTISATTGDAPVTISGLYDGGKIAGEWTAGESKGTWSAMKKEEVAAAAPAAPAAGAATEASIEGTYDAEVTAEGQGSLPFTLIVKKNGDKLVTEVPNAGDLTITAIEVNGENVTLTAAFQGQPFPLAGKRTSTGMGGKWEAGGFTGTWSAKRK